MPLLRSEKIELAKRYLQDAQSAKNVVVLKQSGVPVNETNALRTDIEEAEGKLEVVKKRVFMKGVEDELPDVTPDKFEGSVAVLYSFNENDEHAPLKTVQKHKKAWKKDEHEFGYEYLGGWYDNIWEDSDHVTSLANLPSMEELMSKLVFLLNHPATGFARALQAIIDKEEEEQDDEQTTSEATAQEETEDTEDEEENEEETKDNNKQEDETEGEDAEDKEGETDENTEDKSAEKEG